MAKGKGSSSDKRTGTSKAGKRSGNFTMPPNPSSDRQAGRDLGYQQFVSKAPLFVEKETVVIVMDKNTGLLSYRTKKQNVAAQHVYDATRGRLVTNPNFKEAK